MTDIKELINKFTGMQSLEPLRDYQQKSDDEEMRFRWSLGGTSLIGVALMRTVSLLQNGLIKHLLDPPAGNFRTEKADSSNEAYRCGTSNAPLAVLSHSVILLLTILGRKYRPRRAP